MATPLRIAIIGAGSAGLAMAQQVVEAARMLGSPIGFVIFERRGNVGGIWQHDADVKPGYLAWESEQASLIPATAACKDARRLRYAWEEEVGVGPMFEGLRTNIPNDLMTYRDSPMPQGTDLFPSRHTVQEYLEDYADKNNLRRYIRFNTSVTNLKKHKDGKGWLLTSKRLLNTSQSKIEAFSHVAVCHGRCNTPNIPNIPGLETITAQVSHSAWYRDPSTYIERRILVVGNASSGMDICRELAGYITRDLPSGLTPQEWKRRCKEDPFTVYSSWHSLDKGPGLDYNPLDSDTPDWCRKIIVLPQIERIDGEKIYLDNGTILDDIEHIIFATGYLFDNAFIDQTIEPLLTRPLLPPSSNSSRSGFPSPTVYNVDDWLLFHRQDESIAFLGLPLVVVPFPFTQAQAIYVIHRWIGLAPPLPWLDTSIPSKDPQRWTSRKDNYLQKEEVTDNGVVLDPASLTVSHPSDFAYVDALLRFVKKVDPDAGMVPPWQQDYVSDGLGNGTPKGREDLFATPKWRIERRTNGKMLRRETLGY